MKKIVLFSFFIFIVFLIITLSSAEADIQIISPQNTTYHDVPIIINISSNESVDFLILDERSEDMILANNTTSFIDYIYAKKGSYNFTIWVNNSNGITSKSVVFSIGSPTGPIEITTCGSLYSSNTEYIIMNDIIDGYYYCLYMRRLTNVSIDLKNKRVGAVRKAIFAGLLSDLEIFNGDVYGEQTAALDIIGGKVYLANLTLSGSDGIWAEGNGFLLKNIHFNASNDALVPYNMVNSIVRDSTFEYAGEDNYGNIIFDPSEYSNIIFENVTIEAGFPHQVWLDGIQSDYFLRNTKINSTDGVFRATHGARVFNQHLIVINVTDQTGVGVASVSRSKDSISEGSPEENSLYELVSNPTAEVLSAINEQGIGEVWLTEKLTLHRATSPVTTEEYFFSPYNVTIISRNVTNSTIINVTGNSTYHLSLGLEFPDAQTSSCTLEEILDLNNDAEVNILDSIIILRYITGKEVELGTSKNCDLKSIFVP
jgi:hypothetical protein